MFVFAFPRPPGSGVSAGGATTLSQVVVQPTTSVLRSHVCSAVLLWAIWPIAFLSAQLSQISEQNGVIRSCLVGLRNVLGSSFLDLRSQVFSELTSLHMSRLLGKCAKDFSLFSSSFHPLRLHTVALCPAFPLLGALQSQVHPLLVSTLQSLAVFHCLQLFPQRGSQLSAVTILSCWSSSLPLGAPQFYFDLVPSQLSLRGSQVLLCAFNQFPSASSLLSPCSLGCEALVNSRLCQVEFSSVFSIVRFI